MGDLNQQLVLREDRGAVRVLTMNRPESRNALNTDLISALHTALVHADRDASVRAVVLTGADPAFCAGLDLKQAQRDGSVHFERRVQPPRHPIECRGPRTHPHPLYDRPGGFGDQAAEVWGTDKETAITRMVTEIRPLLTRRMGQPDDIAQVVAYLVSPISRQVTAAEWSVDGGAQHHI